MIYGVMNL